MTVRGRLEHAEPAAAWQRKVGVAVAQPPGAETVLPAGTLRRPRLEARSVSKRVEKRSGGTIAVLHNVSFSVAPGEFVALVGPSGCGKTTLLRLCGGLDAASSGQILVNGVPRQAPGPDRGFALPSDRLMPWRTVVGNVMAGLEVHGVPRRQRREQAMGYLRLVGLAGFAGRYPHELPAELRQRARLARSFCGQPDLLLMDEPFAAVDRRARQVMHRELLRWPEIADSSVVYATRLIDEAIVLADRVIVLTARPGRIKKILGVPFERPRDPSVRDAPEFAALLNVVWRLMEEEVRASMRTADREPADADQTASP